MANNNDFENNDANKTIEEQLKNINESKFKFSFLGLNCFGWIIILLLIVIYFIWKKYF